MKVSKLFAAAVVLSLTATAAQAQLPGLPFYPTPTGMGVMAAADYAHPGTSQTLYAVRGGIGFGPFGVSAAVGQFKYSGIKANITYGATVAMKLFGGGLVPVSITAQAGASQLKSPSFPLIPSTTTTYVPIGVAVRANLPLFPLKPFAVGYYTIGSSDVLKEFRATIGADFNLLLGLGVHAAYDFGTGKNTQNGWGIGAHFNFRMPLPM
jgi:hypothetical protein